MIEQYRKAMAQIHASRELITDTRRQMEKEEGRLLKKRKNSKVERKQ